MTVPHLADAMPTISSLVVMVSADIKKFQAGMAEAEAQTATSTGGMASSISKFGALTAVAAGIAGIALVKFGEEAIKVASEHERTLAQLNLQVGGSTKGFEDQAAALEKLTGFQHDEVLAADTVLARLHLTTTQIQTMVPAILDFAAATGTDAAGAAATFEKALLGTARGLKVGGIAFKDTGTLAGNYAELIKLTSSASIKGSASLDTYAKSQRELGSAFKDIEEQLGMALLPAIKELTQALASLLTALGPVLGAAFAAIGQDAKLLADNVREILGPIQWILERFPGVADGADKTGVSINGLAKAFIDISNPINQMLHPISRFQNAWNDATGATDSATTAINASSDAAAAAAQKEQTLAAAHDAVTEAAKAQRAAEQTLAGGLLGLAADASTLASAQDAVNKLAKQGKTHTDEYRQAILDQLNATVQIKSDLRDYANTLDTAGKSNEDVRNKLVALGKQFGLTRKDVLDAISGANKFTEELKGMAAAGHAAGTGLADGLIAGLAAKKSAVLAAVHGMAAGAIKVLNESLGTNSPSTITEKIGEDVMQGLIDGLKAKERDVQDVFDSLKKRLDNLTSKANDFRSAIAGSFSSLLNLSNIPEGGDIQSFIQASAASAQQWASVLEALKRQGLSGPLLQQIAAMGPEALGMAQQLLQLGPEQIAAINKQYQSILAVQDHVSKSLTEHFFGDKIEELKNQLNEANDHLRHISNRLDNLSGHASGGIFTSPTLGVIGEHGPEAVVPLSAGAGMGGIHVTINGDVTGDEIVRKVRDGLLKLAARNATTGL